MKKLMHTIFMFLLIFSVMSIFSGFSAHGNVKKLEEIREKHNRTTTATRVLNARVE